MFFLSFANVWRELAFNEEETHLDLPSVAVYSRVVVNGPGE